MKTFLFYAAVLIFLSSLLSFSYGSNGIFLFALLFSLGSIVLALRKIICILEEKS
ncbi:hypothetical protein [Clostridium intestinale]|uniref:Uncharacterized protein n=1 Tax=Clostridium intestinale DSM 6191 TaxID=1121320 RepID=A0A1M5YH72_9CLOT|nr:hypothetical protein [Clostridium intestinale]SHI11332.1 hypothetical protein SAMN02745941_01992 [Clostridium intestinale DSM 6191]